MNYSYFWNNSSCLKSCVACLFPYKNLTTNATGSFSLPKTDFVFLHRNTIWDCHFWFVMAAFYSQVKIGDLIQPSQLRSQISAYDAPNKSYSSYDSMSRCVPGSPDFSNEPALSSKLLPSLMTSLFSQESSSTCAQASRVRLGSLFMKTLCKKNIFGEYLFYW